MAEKQSRGLELAGVDSASEILAQSSMHHGERSSRGHAAMPGVGGRGCERSVACRSQCGGAEACLSPNESSEDNTTCAAQLWCEREHVEVRPCPCHALSTLDHGYDGSAADSVQRRVNTEGVGRLQRVEKVVHGLRNLPINLISLRRTGGGELGARLPWWPWRPIWGKLAYCPGGEGRRETEAEMACSAPRKSLWR